MTIDLLSIILIVIAALGVIGLLLSFFHHKKYSAPMKEIYSSSEEHQDQNKKTEEEKKPATRIEPIISEQPRSDSAFASLGFNTLDVLPVITRPEFKLEPVIVPRTPDQKIMEKEKVMEEKKYVVKEIITFYIVAPDERPFVGYELHQALLAADLRFGKMNLFHRHENLDGSGEILFSLASAVEPGFFDLANIGGFSCHGLSIFMRPSKISDPIAAFELMLETACQLSDELGGELCDQECKPLLENDIEAMRSAIASS